MFGGLGSAIGATAGGFFGGPAGAAVGATVGSSFDSYSAQQHANKTNRQISDAQMRFQERMSSTAHQRQVADLRKAGLNPMLSVNTGASTPAGSMTTVEPAYVDSAEAVTTALELKKIKKDLDLADQQIKNQKQDVKNKKALEKKTHTEREALQKTMPRREAEGKAGALLSKGLESVTSSAKSFTKHLPDNSRRRQKTAEYNQEIMYKKSQAYKDRRRKK